jgi:HEAT repeat protein
MASDKDKKRHLTYDKIEANLLVGLQSDNFGLSVSCAYMLGEIKSEKAISTLCCMLRNADDERARIAAAIALIKIGSERSTYVVKESIQMNDSEKVRKMCSHLYKAHLRGDLENTETYGDAMLAQLLTE